MQFRNTYSYETDDHYHTNVKEVNHQKHDGLIELYL